MRAAGTVYVQVGTDDDGHLLIDNGGRDQNAAETLLDVPPDVVAAALSVGRGLNVVLGLGAELGHTPDDGDAALMAFLQSTYEASAETASWDRAALDCALGEPGVPRAH